MSQTPSRPAEAVPRWLIAVGSVVILFHLGAVVTRALAEWSGPWPAPMEMGGTQRFTPPQFAHSLDGMVGPYLGLLGLADRYHFRDNYPSPPGIYLEFRLTDAAGQELATVRLPDEQANFWVRHRQSLLARKLGDDGPIDLPQGELIAAPNQPEQEREFWEERTPNDPKYLRLVRRSVNVLDRNRMYLAPSEVSMIYTRSYVRYLTQSHGAEKVQVLRHHKDAIPPMVLSLRDLQGLPAGAFDETVSDFGEFSK